MPFFLKYPYQSSWWEWKVLFPFFFSPSFEGTLQNGGCVMERLGKLGVYIKCERSWLRATHIQSQSSLFTLLCSTVYLRQGVLSQHITSAHVNTQGAYIAYRIVFSPPAFVPKPLSHRETSSPMARWMGCWYKIICGSQRVGERERGRREEGEMTWGLKNERNSPNFSQRGTVRQLGTQEERCLSAERGHGWVSWESWLKWLLSQELDGQLISSSPKGKLGLWQGYFIPPTTHTHTHSQR